MVIKWKNILNRGNKTDRAPAPAACPAGGRLRAAAGLTAFLLGISLLLAGGLGQYGWWSTELGARWARDSLEEDWQDTAAFRTIICNWLDACLTAGTWEYTSGGDYGKELLDGLEGDKNLLYAVARRGSVLYTNTSDGGFLSSGQPPEGYRFALRCEDGMVSITQDGRELDVYGDGWYTEDDLWFVPGYENFPMDADARNIQVYLAAASDPKPMVYGNYLGSGADICTSQLYDLVQNLAQYRRELLTEWGMLGGGALLLALALVLRRDKARADRFLARGTGRIWFEVKVLLALLALLLLPWGELSSWSSETPVASYTAASSTASSGSAQWDTGAVALYSYSGDVVQSQAETHVYGTGEGPDVLFDFLQALGTRPAAAVLAFLALYLLVFNDLRYNRQAARSAGDAGRPGAGAPCPEAAQPLRRPGLPVLSAAELRHSRSADLVLQLVLGLRPAGDGLAPLSAAPSARCCDSGIPVPPAPAVGGSGGAHRSDRRRPGGGAGPPPGTAPGPRPVPGGG